MPLSDFVGLEPLVKTVMASPSRMLPPTNSLPPRRCPRPCGRVGINRGELCADGDSGGLRNILSALGGSGKEAPGLNEKAGRGGGREAGFPLSTSTLGKASRGSIADRGRLAVVRGNVVEEEERGRGGNTNGGFGGGGFDLGTTCGRERGTWEAVSAGSRRVASCSWSGDGGSIIMLGPSVVAIFPKPLGGTRLNDNLERE